MLFDLRARGRRRTVQVVYLGLAILFGLGFIGFGVGGGFGGGGVLEGVFGNKEGSSSASFTKQVSAAETRTHKYPSEAAAWAALADARVHEANGSEFYDETTQQFTAKGKELLTKAAGAWNRYVALNPSKPNITVAQDMLRVFSEEGLNQPAEAVQVMQLVIAAKPPSAALYGRLAAYAYQAKNTRVGDLAAQKTITLTPAAQRSKVETELARIKSNPTGNPSKETFTGTTNGKVYTVKVGSKGEGTVLKTSPAPATTSTTTTKK
ncbi:MAG TPA: hypothetical protein VK781_01315 [Solirubrobacteraceae bacterium]|jgi:hypothetical protein|nr:hypothetical protein [Solirubrobacteraceae bacterium]